jgi:hypothetical protein
MPPAADAESEKPAALASDAGALQVKSQQYGLFSFALAILPLQYARCASEAGFN